MMETNELDQGSLNILKAVVEAIDGGLPPTTRELLPEVPGAKSSFSVTWRLAKLEKAGLVTRRRTARGIQVTKAGRARARSMR